MKLAIHIHDFGAAVHIGVPTETMTAIMDIPNDQLPQIVRNYLVKELERKKIGDVNYVSISFSRVEEEK